MGKEYKIINKESLEEQKRNNDFLLFVNRMSIGLNALGIVLNIAFGASNIPLLSTNIALLGWSGNNLINCLSEKAGLEQQLKEFKANNEKEFQENASKSK